MIRAAGLVDVQRDEQSEGQVRRLAPHGAEALDLKRVRAVLQVVGDVLAQVRLELARAAAAHSAGLDGLGSTTTLLKILVLS